MDSRGFRRQSLWIRQAAGGMVKNRSCWARCRKRKHRFAASSPFGVFRFLRLHSSACSEGKTVLGGWCGWSRVAQNLSDLRTDADLIVRGLKGRVIHIFHYISLGCLARETDQACSGVAYVYLSNIICFALLRILFKAIKGSCRPQTRRAVVEGKACMFLHMGGGRMGASVTHKNQTDAPLFGMQQSWCVKCHIVGFIDASQRQQPRALYVACLVCLWFLDYQWDRNEHERHTEALRAESTHHPEHKGLDHSAIGLGDG